MSASKPHSERVQGLRNLRKGYDPVAAVGFWNELHGEDLIDVYADLVEQNESLLRDNETLGILNETLKQQLETCRGLLKQALDENIRLRTALTMIRDHRSPGGSQLISGREAEAIAWAALQPSGGAGLADPSDLSRAPVAGATPPVSNPADIHSDGDIHNDCENGLSGDPARSRPCEDCDGIGAQAGAHTERVEPCPACDGSGRKKVEPDTWERFPTDEVSLTMLAAACAINPDTGHTELKRFLDMTGGEVTSVSMNGIAYDSVDEALADVDENYGPPILEIEHDKPPHSEHTVIISLIEEIRRLRESNQERDRDDSNRGDTSPASRPT